MIVAACSGVREEEIKTKLTVLTQMKYFVKTAFGISSRHFMNGYFRNDRICTAFGLTLTGPHLSAVEPPFPHILLLITQLHIHVFSVSFCPSVLTMSFPAPCADSVHPPGMLTCNIAPLCLPKQNGTVLVNAFPRFPHLMSTTLWYQVFVVIKIAMRLMECFLQRHSEHWWQHHGTTMTTITKLKRPRNSFGVLSHNIPMVLYQFQVIITNKCSWRSILSPF